MGQHCQAFRERNGRDHPIVANAPVLPVGCAHLWADFMELHGSRAVSELGPRQITFLEIDAWERVNGVKLEAWELAAIRKADAAFMARGAK